MITKAGLKKRLHTMGIKTYKNKNTAQVFIKKKDIHNILAAEEDKNVYNLTGGSEVHLGPNSIVHETDLETFIYLEEVTDWLSEFVEQYKGQNVKVTFNEKILVVVVDFDIGNVWFEIEPKESFDERERDQINKALKGLK